MPETPQQPEPLRDRIIGWLLVLLGCICGLFAAAPGKG
jgi:hypothetical protein